MVNTGFPTSNNRTPSPSVNPFARALAEARGNQGQNGLSDDFLSQGNRFADTNSNSNDFAEQQRLQEEKQKRERLRQQLHRQVNPVEAKDVFDAREERVKKEIDSIRHELKMLSQEVIAFDKEVELTIISNVAEPGLEGKYYFSFFQKLREFIMLLRKRIHSARTWATTMQSKKKKKKGKMGMEISGQQYEQTTTVFDRMHHERSTAYSGS